MRGKHEVAAERRGRQYSLACSAPVRARCSASRLTGTHVPTAVVHERGDVAGCSARSGRRPLAARPDRRVREEERAPSAERVSGAPRRAAIRTQRGGRSPLPRLGACAGIEPTRGARSSPQRRASSSARPSALERVERAVAAAARTRRSSSRTIYVVHMYVHSHAHTSTPDERGCVRRALERRGVAWRRASVPPLPWAAARSSSSGSSGPSRPCGTARRSSCRDRSSAPCSRCCCSTRARSSRPTG